MSHGDRCPCCNKGKLYNGESRKSLEFTGNPPITATRHELKSLRCNYCQKEYVAQGRKSKWQSSARSSIILLKILGFPYYRLSKLQLMHNIPISDTTAWAQFKYVWDSIAHIALEELKEEITEETNTYYIDDTGAKILEVIKANKLLPEGEKGRACHTTVINGTTKEKHNVVLYITSNQHCGENIGPIIDNKTNKRSDVRIMSDASSMNKPVLIKYNLKLIFEQAIEAAKLEAREIGIKLVNGKLYSIAKDQEDLELLVKKDDNDDIGVSPNLYDSMKRALIHNKTSFIFSKKDRSQLINFAKIKGQIISNKIILVNCLAHVMIKFDEIKHFFPEECGAILDELTSIYDNENYCINNNLSSKKRLKYHQENSIKYIKNINKKIRESFDQKKVEPNGALGKVMKYWLNHQEALTMFTKIRGVKLDNNSSERLVKVIIAQRKNSMFNATLESARINSGMSSLVETCRANGINAFEYFNWLQDNEAMLRKNRKATLPWKMKEYTNNTELILAA
jgi:hypothetical protein